MTKKVKTCDHTCFMCKYVGVEWRENINIKRTVICLKKGQQFIAEGGSVDGVYFVQQGLVKVYQCRGGKDSIVRFAKKGDIVGHRGVAVGKSLFPISAMCVEDSVLCFIPIDFFKVLLKTNIGLTYELLMFYAEELQVSEQKVVNQTRLSVKGRLAWSIVQLENKLGIDEDGYIAMVLSKTDLAAYVGCTYESAYRMLAELVGEGVLCLANKRVKIKDKVRLLYYSEV